MSVLIKGMEMPKDTVVTINIWADGHVYILGKNPMMLHDAAVELPTHGDLIDRDKLKHGFCVECTLYPDNCLGENCDWDSIYHIERAPVVIPAERE